MHKTWLVISREYLSRVKKKSFIIITLLIPVLAAGMFALEIFLAMGGNKETQHIAVIDESGFLGDGLQDGEQLFFTGIHDQDPKAFVSQYQKAGYNGLLVIPRIDLVHPAGFTYYAPHQLGLSPYLYITGQLNKVIEQKRMLEAGIDQAKLDRIKADVSLSQPGSDLSGSGKHNGLVTEAATAIGYILGILIYLILFFYGMQVMRGVAEEKVNRVAEVLVSSVRPFQMMIGKVVGIAAVGLTQFLIWIILGLVTFLIFGALAPGMMPHGETISQAQQLGQAASPQVADAMSSVTHMIQSLPIVRILVCFLFYFLGGYLLYAALFAAVGSAVDQEMTESQALTLPITLPLIISFFIMFNTIQQPNSPLSVFASIFPLSSPLVMIARLPFGVPWWQLLLSMVLLVVGFLFTIWLAGRIYRTGILLYGKKVTLRELGKWIFRKY